MTTPNLFSDTLGRYFRSGLAALALSLGLGMAQNALALPVVLTFDDIPAGFDVTSQYTSFGVTVSGATIEDSFFSQWQANSGQNVAYAPNGLMSFTLDSLITGNIQYFSAYISTDNSIHAIATSISAYDATNTLLDQAVITQSTNNQFVAFSTGNAIARIELNGGGGIYIVDTLTFATSADIAAVPEPATIWLLGLGLLGLAGLVRQTDRTDDA